MSYRTHTDDELRTMGETWACGVLATTPGTRDHAEMLRELNAVHDEITRRADPVQVARDDLIGTVSGVFGVALLALILVLVMSACRQPPTAPAPEPLSAADSAATCLIQRTSRDKLLVARWCRPDSLTMRGTAR